MILGFCCIEKAEQLRVLFYLVKIIAFSSEMLDVPASQNAAAETLRAWSSSTIDLRSFA